jgi:hypothetical protein
MAFYSLLRLKFIFLSSISMGYNLAGHDHICLCVPDFLLIHPQRNWRGPCDPGALHAAMGQGQRSRTQRHQRAGFRVGLREAGDGNERSFCRTGRQSAQDDEVIERIQN